MISFTIALLALVVGYLFYGKFIEHVMGPDNRLTPAVAKADGVDYIVMPGWKIFMIQFLNIAGTGPIFGAIRRSCARLSFRYAVYATWWSRIARTCWQVFGQHHQECDACVLGIVARHGGRSVCIQSCHHP